MQFPSIAGQRAFYQLFNDAEDFVFVNRRYVSVDILQLSFGC